MAVATSPSAEGVVILHDISWDFYARLVAEVGHSPATRITYDNGLLQIMVVSAGHESPNRILARIAEIAVHELDFDAWPVGSATFQRQDLLKGFEPDSCFYFENASRVRGKAQIDLSVHPPPELVIEVDVTSQSLDRFPIFAAVGVAEVWRFTNDAVSVHGRQGDGYVPMDRSRVLPVLTAEMLTLFVTWANEMRWNPWIARVHRAIRQELTGNRATAPSPS